jgi:CMP/dCMP kinase
VSPGTIVAIDGPAGSGKSSVSRAAAKELGFDYLDTGAAYRALAWRCIDEGIDTYGPSDVVESLATFEFEIGIDPDHYFVCVGLEDVTEEIREPSVAAIVSSVARIPEVRAHMVNLFRHIIAASTQPGIVVEGRDITTVVAPDAPVRVLLTASEDVRMGRRSAELAGVSASVTARELNSRDVQDSQVVDFMNAAAGVITVDSTYLDFEQTVQSVVSLVRTGTQD